MPAAFSAESLPCISSRVIATIMLEHGSLAPLSISSSEVAFSLRPSWRALSTKNTDAASVDPRTEPSSRLSNQPQCRRKCTISAVTAAVRKTPTEASSEAGATITLAFSHLVQKPP